MYIILHLLKVKGLDIPLPEMAYTRRQPTRDLSLEDANRIIFSPWDAISSYEETVTDVIDIPGNIDGTLASSNTGSVRKNKLDSTTLPVPRLEQITSKIISSEEEKSNKTSSFNQLVVRVQPSHFLKVWHNFMDIFYRYSFNLLFFK